MALAAPSIDTAKLVNIFHTTKYFDNNFQNIFNYFFLPAQGKSFSCPESHIFHIFNDLAVAWQTWHFQKMESKRCDANVKI